MKNNIIYFICGVSVSLCICLSIYVFVLKGNTNEPKNIINTSVQKHEQKNVEVSYLTVKNNRNYPYYVYVNNDLKCEVSKNSESGKIKIKPGFNKVELKQASGFVLEPRIFVKEYKDIKPNESVIFNLHY